MFISSVILYSPLKMNYYSIDTFRYDVWLTSMQMNLAVVGYKLVLVSIVAGYTKKVFGLNPLDLLHYNLHQNFLFLFFVLTLEVVAHPLPPTLSPPSLLPAVFCLRTWPLARARRTRRSRTSSTSPWA